MKTTIAAMLRAGCYVGGLFVLANTALLWMSAEDAGVIFQENGRLELIQVGLLVLMLLIVFDGARRLPSTRPFSVLLVGAALAALVREHNNWFKDEIGSNVWQALVAVILVVAALLARRLGGDPRAALRDLVARPAFGWMAAGVGVFMFGQVLDEVALWQLLLGDDPPYMARRMAEECFETAAYWLLAAGLLEWRLTARRGSTMEAA